ncbi:signal peptidase I [Taylorella equigenitalis]|uniref:Signal peptidase I n=3 Tax=Taylorella equigenitalis TaxID=29575 RepID=A0A654KI22_TAYEM|nr:signal peptidase I [Taylorella equigenitalis]ADU92029.1 Signal peptidase I [Taylorella equigenitalis MCE9]AFN35591.1 signal peptidase I [Taylorella equigenitalis ATCC 35865]ASY30245.1 S26 family signal peptidase [Taylorella equigenitalis]ASY37548.1 S26 family signal peptidase [Taylorella equigenitalis]ASY39017.1 S26 family signal peptidase [Taylorella equigenitalis]
MDIVFLVLVIVTFTAMALEKYVLKPRRIRLYGSEADKYSNGFLNYIGSLFGLVLFIFLLRAFVVEPFRIPSGSMLPTLQKGDFILVNKFKYGLRFPIINQKLVSLGSPNRGDIVVFRYPLNTSQDYIKRIIGIPGDVIVYENKQLYVNGKAIESISDGPYVKAEQQSGKPELYKEKLFSIEHGILQMPGLYPIKPIEQFEGIESCKYYLQSAVECKVPEGHYFVMGDNRDNSLDSRYWGFVPDKYLAGKAFFIWLNFEDFGRIGPIK